MPGKKIVIIGPEQSGKTQLLNRWVKNSYNGDYEPTIGVEFKSTNKLQIWDTAGQLRFNSIIPSYVRGAAAVVITCDLTKENALEEADKWFNMVKSYLFSNTPIIFVGTKADDKDEQKISNSDLIQFAHNKNYPYSITSAKTGDGIKAMIENIENVLKVVNKDAIEKDIQEVKSAMEDNINKMGSNKLDNVFQQISQPQLFEMPSNKLIDDTYAALKEAYERLEENLKDFVRNHAIVGQGQKAEDLMNQYLGVGSQYTISSDKDLHKRLFKPADQAKAEEVKTQWDLLREIKKDCFSQIDLDLEAKEKELRDFEKRFSEQLANKKLKEVFKTPDSKSANGWIALKVIVSIIGGIIIPAIAFAAHAYATTGSANFFKGKHERLRETLNEKVEKARNTPK